MGRPKKNVEKDIKKEVKRGRPKKVEPTLEERVKLLELEVDKLSKHQKDIDDDLNTLCEDFYCQCDNNEEDTDDYLDKWDEIIDKLGMRKPDIKKEIPTVRVYTRIIRF